MDPDGDHRACTMVLAIDRLFRWRLYLDACRRVKHT